jgi:hypothetical protein
MVVSIFGKSSHDDPSTPYEAIQRQQKDRIFHFHHHHLRKISRSPIDTLALRILAALTLAATTHVVCRSENRFAKTPGLGSLYYR